MSTSLAAKYKGDICDGAFDASCLMLNAGVYFHLNHLLHPARVFAYFKVIPSIRSVTTGHGHTNKLQTDTLHRHKLMNTPSSIVFLFIQDQMTKFKYSLSFFSPLSIPSFHWHQALQVSTDVQKSNILESS